MTNNDSKFGIIMSVAVTAIALGVVGSIGAVEDVSISSQGERIIETTATDVENIPDVVQDITSDALDVSEEIIDESDSIPEAVDNTVDVLEDDLPDVPKVVKQADGKLLELVSIPEDTGVPGCEESNTCYIPATSEISPNGEVIWTNHDNVAHTVTSGTPHDGPDGLFDSGLMLPGDTYSQTFGLVFEYDYFCIVHPWMQGSVVVE